MMKKCRKLFTNCDGVLSCIAPFADDVSRDKCFNGLGECEFRDIIRKKGSLICPHCGKPMTKHIIKEGARYHVTSWHQGVNGALSHCSEPDCENNHGPGHCVPLIKDNRTF